jgi:hypothetical protein
MAEPAFRAYIRACAATEVNPAQRIMQTIGDAPASKGYHSADGKLNSVLYCAAVDLATSDLTRNQIKNLLEQLARNGFAAWYRFAGAFSNNEHIHAVYAGVPMKAQLRAQIVDFLNDRTGLTGHKTETFYTAPRRIDIAINALFLHANPTTKEA